MDYIFERGNFTESELEAAIIELFKNEDYTYQSGEYMHREYDEIILKGELRSFLANCYAKNHITENEIETCISRLENISDTPLYEGNKETYLLVTEGFDLIRDNINETPIHISFIDFEDINNNSFKVINQYSITDNERTRRPDLIVFINGIPVAICEFKSAIKQDTTIHNAWKQITTRYCRDIPSLMRYCFLSVISDGANNRLGSIFTPYEYYYAWNKANDEDKVSNGISSLLTMIKGAFAKDRILQILRDFIYYPDTSKTNASPIVCRYPQFFAANKLLDSISNALKPVGDGKGGTYFGATGCGKTYTMLYLTRLLVRDYKTKFNNPTIVIIEDREDLDTQTSKIFTYAKRYFHDDDVRSIESREDLSKTLKDKPGGGVYITTIQKFCSETGLLSDRNNIICISDEAHRTQTNTGSKIKRTEQGVFTTYGFAHYLRESFPNATYCGVTGTPIDETYAVFGKEVDRYTMKEASDDGITVRIAYEPRLARVIVSESQAKEIEKYYQDCIKEGSNEDQVEESKRAMSAMRVILSNPDRQRNLSLDLIEHYEKLVAQKPKIVQKAMIVCADRELAYTVYKNLIKYRPEWGVPKRCEDESKLTKEELEKLKELPMVNLVATRDKDDKKELYDLLGTKEYRQMLDEQFKNDDSNFKIAIVVDMWITGFDVPSLSVMYIDKPLQKHTLVQTISRVNRVFEGKDQGLVVDYIGFRDDMLKAVKQYSGEDEGNPIDELMTALSIFRNQLKLIDDLLVNFDASEFFKGDPLKRLLCLNDAAEYVQISKEMEGRFMKLSKQMKAAYDIVFPSGELSDIETSEAQFYLAIRSIIYKQTKGTAPDAETMNKVVEGMVKKAIACTGVESIIDTDKVEDLSSVEFFKNVEKIKMPITKFNALIKILNGKIKGYGKINKVKALEFDERLKKVVDRYNERDSLVFTSEVVDDFVNDLSEEILNIIKDLDEDKTSFEKMGITFEEKAFYDILVKVRDTHQFKYEDDKCIDLAKKIKELVDDKSRYADWATRDDIKNELNRDLTVLLYKNGYPPEWDEEVFEKVMQQAENFKKHMN